MSNFVAIMSAHKADGALVMADANARAALIARIASCKTKKAQADMEVWLWGYRMVYRAMQDHKVSIDKAIALVDIEKEKKGDAAAWFKKANGAARVYAHAIRKAAGLGATDKRGGKRANAGRKANAPKAEPVKAAPKAEPVKAETPKVATDYKPATPRESAMFLRENIAALVSIAKGAHNSADMIKALTAALAAAQKEIANCE